MRTLVLGACVAAAGCGDDEAGSPGERPDQGSAFITLAEAEDVIEKGRLAVVRTGADADIGAATADAKLEDAALVDAARYESQSGREFDLLVFASPAAARRASPVVDAADGGAAIRAANVIAVFPTRPEQVDAYRAVARAMRRLADACESGATDDAGLRRVCFGPGPAPGEPAEGVDRDEAQDEEEPIVVEGLHYDPLLARRLNPNIAPDKSLVSGRAPPPGKIWFGVFLRVCNRGERLRAASDQLRLVDAFGQRVEPADLPSDNPFVYRPSALKPGECLPRRGSAAAQNDGALVVFAVSSKILSETPVALEVEDRRVILDV